MLLEYNRDIMQILTIERSEKLKTLSVNPYFQGLNEVSLKEISSHMRLKRFVRGEVLFWEGDECAGLHIIQHGIVE